MTPRAACGVTPQGAMRVARQNRFHRILVLVHALRGLCGARLRAACGVTPQGAMRVARQSRFHRILGLVHALRKLSGAGL